MLPSEKLVHDAANLKYYKQVKVQEALLRHAENREISIRLGEGFGKRPDVLVYPADVLGFALKKATSFHCSEERWRDPLQIQTGMSRKQQDDIRTGWDLVLDIDCPHWEFSKLTTYLFVKTLQAHGIKDITCKFSGSKGFHIGVPFESFPEMHNDSHTKDLFPEIPRAIAEYLLEYMSDPDNNLIITNNDTVTFLPGEKDLTYTFDQLKEYVLEGKKFSQLHCSECNALWKEEEKDKFCPSCQEKIVPGTLRCQKCSHILETATTKFACSTCKAQNSPITKINFASLIEVDTILLASRHLFRMAYSLHERSGFVSAPIAVSNILSFEKEDAHQDKVDYTQTFLPKGKNPGEASTLMIKSMNLAATQQAEAVLERKAFEAPEDAIEPELFPPCMNIILAGIKDGKKRALFILTNFLKSVGWTTEMIKDAIYDWNERNPEKLREVIIKGHLQLKAKKKEVIMPPNCTSDYYKALGVCQPEDFCRTIKNPAQYTLKKYKLANFKRDGSKKAKRVPLTEEQKEMRRKHKAKLKEEKQEKESNETNDQE